MRFTGEEIDVPNLWLGEGSFGGRRPSNRCGTVAPYTEEVRAAMREVRRSEPLRPAETTEAARAALAAYVIHPLFYQGTAADLAAEYLQEIHHLGAADVPLLWTLYAAAAHELGFAGVIPVPVLNPEVRACS